MKSHLSLIATFGLLTAAGTAIAQSGQSQTQNGGSQYSTQNNGSTHQSLYQTNGRNGAGQGAGTGNNRAQADYNASAAIRSAPVYPQGSTQTQTQESGGLAAAGARPRGRRRRGRRGSSGRPARGTCSRRGDWGRGPGKSGAPPPANWLRSAAARTFQPPMCGR